MLLTVYSQYALLTGVAPIHDVCSEDSVGQFIVGGHLPFIHPKWAWHSYAESQLAEIIMECLVYDPEDRISIGDLVQRLRQVAWENRRREARGQ